MKTKQELLNEGLISVKKMGFRMVTNTNIFYDEVYSSYFENMLLQKKGSSLYLDEIIDEMISQIETQKQLNP